LDKAHAPAILKECVEILFSLIDKLLAKSLRVELKSYDFKIHFSTDEEKNGALTSGRESLLCSKTNEKNLTLTVEDLSFLRVYLFALPC
jgi:hypothetical protein